MTRHQFFIPAGSTVGNGLDAQTAFVTLALLNTMRSAFRLIPSCITAFSQVSASFFGPALIYVVTIHNVLYVR